MKINRLALLALVLVASSCARIQAGLAEANKPSCVPDYVWKSTYYTPGISTVSYHDLTGSYNNPYLPSHY